MNFITTCTVLLMVFVIHSAYGFDVVLKDKDCPGNDVNKINKPLVGCMKDCNNAGASCIRIVYDATNTCWMKSKCDKKQDLTGSSIYLKPTDGFDFKKGLTCPGNDIAIFRKQMSITECMIQCHKNRACIAVTYKRGACTGKSKCVTTKRSRSVITYFRSKGNIEVIPEMNCPGNDINPHGLDKSLTQCLQLCGEESECIGIVLTNTACWLKLQCTTRIPHRSDIYLLPSTFQVITRTNCPGNDINKTGMHISLLLCLQLCGEIPRCVGIVNSDKTGCWLKVYCTTRVPHTSDIYLK